MSTPAKNVNPMIRQWNRIHQQTLKIVELAPDDKFDWKTCDSAMPLGELANHFYLAEKGLISALQSGKFTSGDAQPKSTTAELVAAFNETHEALVAVLSDLTDEQLAEEIAPFGEKYGTMSKRTLLHSMQEHEIHHRGQLYVYLRMLGVTVPSLFG